MVTGGQAMVECLRREGVSHVFGIPGTQNLGVVDALSDARDIRFILTRHEQGAAFMAYGFGRESGRPAVVTATEGPGVTNLATGIAAAYKGFVPMLTLTGCQEEAIRHRETSQEIDQLTFMRPITKWAYGIPHAGKVQEALRRAFRIALDDPFGPVHLEASRDVWSGQTELEAWAPAAYRAQARPECSPAQLDETLRLIQEAKRPVFVAGNGVIYEEAGEALARLAELTGIPVATLQISVDAFPSTHPLGLGMMGRNGSSVANQMVRESDLIVLVGGRFDFFTTDFKYGVVPPGAKIVHHATVATQIGQVFPVELAVVGSTRSFVDGLAERAALAGQPAREWPELERARADFQAERAAMVRADAVPIDPPFVAHTVRQVLPSNGVVIVDAGNAAKHMRTQFDAYEPGTFMYINDWGSVGGGLPIGIGVKLARPDRPVICVEGDMGMMANVGEMETAVREQIPVVCVVFNDWGLGNERAWQRQIYGDRIYGVDYSSVDFGAIARAMGAHGEQVHQPGDLAPAIRRALESGKPAIVDVLIDQNSFAPVVFKQ